MTVQDLLRYRVRKCECGVCGQWIVYYRNGRLAARKGSFEKALEEAVKLGDRLRRDIHKSRQEKRFK